MPINGKTLILAKPIKNMLRTKMRAHGVSYGLSEVGYDIRVKQTVMFTPPNPKMFVAMINKPPRVIGEDYEIALRKAMFGSTMVDSPEGFVETIGRTALASSLEEFDMPTHLWGELRNKSTHARRFIDATIGTDVEPGWKGFLTIEIIFHGHEQQVINAGSGILKAVFHRLSDEACYPDNGKYQNQEDRPVAPILE